MEKIKRIQISVIKLDSFKLKFKKLLVIDMYSSFGADGLEYIFQESKFGLYFIHGGPINEVGIKYATRQIEKDFGILWDEYVKCDIALLAKDALRLRKKLLKTAEEIRKGE